MCAFMGVTTNLKVGFFSTSQNLVESGTGAHSSRGLLVIRKIIATNITRRALHSKHFLDNLLFVGSQLFSKRGKLLAQVLVLPLCSEGLGPIESHVEVTSSVVDATHLAGRRLVVQEVESCGLVESLAQNTGLGVVELLSQVSEAHSQSKELAKRIPTDIILLQELLDVLG